MPLARILRSPDPLKEALYMPAHSLIDQSLHSRLGAETTNGDGFGVGWYGEAPDPGVFHSTEPAWNDHNLHELADHICSPHLLHPHPRGDRQRRAADELPPVPPRELAVHAQRLHQRVRDVKRDLVLAVDPSLFPEIQGQTDTEVLFYLALTFGLEDDPPAAIEQAIGLVEAVGSRLGVPHPFQGTIATTDGERTWAVRYSSEGKSRSLFYTTDVPTLRELYPERELPPGVLGRHAADRLRAARRRRRRLERGARGDLRRRRPRRRRAAAVPPEGAGDVGARGEPDARGPADLLGGVRTTSTGRCVSCSSLREVEPSTRALIPPSPREPTTIARASRSSAIAMSVSATLAESGTESASAVAPSSRARRAPASATSPAWPDWARSIAATSSGSGR